MENKHIPETRVMIGIGCQDTVKSTTLASVAGVLIKSAGKVTAFSMRKGGDIVSARTWLVREALKHNSTHILFVDSDMQFPQDALEKMLAHNKDIVGVEYYRRKLPLEPVFQPLDEQSKTDIYKAGFAATGLLLIKTSVFTSEIRPIAEPWFNFGRNKAGEVVLGEDVWFCNTVRDAGFEVWIDPTIKVGHIGEYIYGEVAPSVESTNAFVVGAADSTEGTTPNTTL